MFEFQITLNDDDYLLFNQYHLLNSPNGKKTLLSYRIIIPFISFMFIIIFFIANSDIQLILYEAIAMTIISVLWIVFSKKMLFKSMKSWSYEPNREI